MVTGQKKPKEEMRTIPYCIRMNKEEDRKLWKNFGEWRLENPKGSKTDYMIECCCK